MNPVFIFLVLLGAFALWFLLSFAYKPVGKFFYRLWKKTMNEIGEDDEQKKKK